MATRTVLMSNTGTPLPSFRYPHDRHRDTAPRRNPQAIQVPSYKVEQVYRANCSVCGLVCEASDKSAVDRQMQLHCQTHAPADPNRREFHWELRPRTTSP